MKKALKILSLVLVFALVMAPVVTLAVPIEDFTGGGDVEALNKLNPIIGTIITVLQWIGYAVAVVMILWLGVQWMLAQPSKKAELKGKMWSMAVGILLLVGGVSLLKIVWSLAEQGTSGLAN